MWKVRGLNPSKGTKRRSLKRPKSLSTTDTSGAPHEASHVLPSDLDLSATSAGSEPPPHKHKHRVKLWNSFLNKTKNIRIRKKDKSPSGAVKLHRRSSSQPNIPINVTPSNHAVTNKDSGRATKSLSNGTDAGHVVAADSKRTKYRKQKDQLSRSSSSLNDSTFTSLSGAAKVRGAPGRYSDSIEDDSYGSLVEQTSSAAYRSVSDPTLTPEREARLDSYHNGRRKLSKAPSIDKEGEDDDEGEEVKENEEAEDDVPVLIQSLPVTPDTPDDTSTRDHRHKRLRSRLEDSKSVSFASTELDADTTTWDSSACQDATSEEGEEVSKSVDSLLSVASSISLPPEASLRSQPRSDRHSLHSQGPGGHGAPSAGQVRRHSCDFNTKDSSEDHEFYDCEDGVSEADVTSSSQEPSPVNRPKEVRRGLKDSPEHWGSSPVRVKRQSTLSSLGASFSLTSDWDSAESDIDEKSSNALDAESHTYGMSDDDNSSLTNSPVIAVHTTAGQDSSLAPVSHHLSQPRSFFTVHVHLKEGRDLVIRDACGTSDPYVKFKIGGKVVYKSRIIYKNLNPKWDEKFTIPIEDITKPITIKVFDYDRAWNDDPMGGYDLDVKTLEINKETDLKLELTERGNTEYMGYLLLTCTLTPKADEEKEQIFRRSTRSTESAATSKKIKMQQWNGVVNITLVEGSNLVSMDDNGLSDPYVKFRLGPDKYRSKFKSKTLNPRWLENFDLRLFDDQSSQLEITVYDHDTRGKDDFMGRAVIELSQLEKERTHNIVQPLEDGAGTITLLLTVSGTFGSEMASNLANYTPNALDKDKIVNKYGLLNSFRNLDDIGHLEVKVWKAHNLQSADFGGLSDPFCVLELVNNRVQTQTEYKTLNPEWGKVFTFQVKDIHSVLEVTVYDEDRNKKVEFLGKFAIPLLKVRNGDRRWYALKDRKMVHKTRGSVQLEMDLVFNHIKAAVRTVNPKEEKLLLPEQKFKIAAMKQNINRVSQLVSVFMDTGRFIQSCFDWQSPPRTITAFIVYLVIVWNFELYMLPISLLLIFLKNYVIANIVGSFKKEPVEDEYEEDEDDDEEEKDKQEEKKSIVDRYHAIQEVCLQVQQGLDSVACLGERIKNTFNWSVPWLSTLAVIALSAGIIVLYFIPLRYLLLAWGINKFTKKLRKPNAISNNELLDFLSRVPSDKELVQFREFKAEIPANTMSTKKKRS